MGTSATLPTTNPASDSDGQLGISNSRKGRGLVYPSDWRPRGPFLPCAVPVQKFDPESHLK